jgi:hypothetical protein
MSGHQPSGSTTNWTVSVGHSLIRVMAYALLFMLQKCATIVVHVPKFKHQMTNVCHDQCVASHDDMTRFGATMHQLLCKILVIMQLACK